MDFLVFDFAVGTTFLLYTTGFEQIYELAVFFTQITRRYLTYIQSDKSSRGLSKLEDEDRAAANSCSRCRYQKM